jgi:hypothetical protein
MFQTFSLDIAKNIVQCYPMKANVITQRQILAMIRKAMPQPSRAFKVAKAYNRKDKSWKGEF